MKHTFVISNDTRNQIKHTTAELRSSLLQMSLQQNEVYWSNKVSNKVKQFLSDVWEFRRTEY